MSRVLMEACRQAPGTPSEQGWLSRIVKSASGYHHVIRTRYRITALGEAPETIDLGHPVSFPEAHRAFLDALAVRETMAWVTVPPKTWRWQAQLGECVFEEAIEFSRAPWFPTDFTPIPIREVAPLLAAERYMLQRRRPGVRLRVIAEGAHLFAVTPDRQLHSLSAPIRSALEQWQFSRGDFEVEAVPVEESLFLVDWIDPPGCARTAVDRWQAIQTATLPTPLERELTAFSRPYKQELWEQALRDGWEGVTFRRTEIAHVRGKSDYDFCLSLWHETRYVVDQLLPKQRNKPRQLTVRFPLLGGGWVGLGPVCGRELSREDWRALERFRDCHAAAVVRVRYTHWDPQSQRLMNGRAVGIEPRLGRADCLDAGAHLASGIRYLF